MATKHVIKMWAINEFFEKDHKTMKRGENALESNHVSQMQFDAGLMILRGKVQASMKDKTYNIMININQSGEINDASCSCPRGLKCHHIAALALFGHYNLSVTDIECTWNAVKIKEADVKTANDLYPSKNYNPVKRILSEDEIDDLRNKLGRLGNTVGFHWLLQKESRNIDNFAYLPIIEQIICSAGYIQSSNKALYLRNKCSLDDPAVQHIADITTGQSQNELWLIMRKFRLTSSNFGAVINAHHRNKFSDSLFKTLIGCYNLDGIKAIQWGRSNERNGIIYMEKELNVKIDPTGLWLSNSGVLGASPDGLIGQEATVEVKCPYKYRNEMLSEKLKNDKTYIISYSENGDIVVNKKRTYYHQIQGTLHLTKRKKCYLCIWTPKESIICTIDIDSSWTTNLNILEMFYDNRYLPRLNADLSSD